MATTVDPHGLDNTYDDASKRTPLVLGGLDYQGVTETACGFWEAEKAPKIWWILLLLAMSLLGILGGLINHLLMSGVGVWGNNNPAYWGWPIVNFVFWVGIGHAGTLISAILFLFRQNWRTSINRAAEAMTISVGRVRCFDLRDSVAVVLVHGHGSRYRNLPRPHQEPHWKVHLRFAFFGLDRIGTQLASLRDRLHIAGRTGDTASSLGSHDR